MKISNAETGQTLIEVLVALTTAVVIIAAIVSASLSALSSSEYMKNQNIAAQYTQQGIEILRDMRNTSIASISAAYLPDNTYCLASSCTALNNSLPACWQKNSSCGQNVGTYVREVTVVHDTAYCNTAPTPTGVPSGILPTNVQITVTTSWYDSKCTDPLNQFCHSVSASTCFSDFTVVSTP